MVLNNGLRIGANKRKVSVFEFGVLFKQVIRIDITTRAKGIRGLRDRRILGRCLVLHIVLDHFPQLIDILDIRYAHKVILCRIDKDVATQDGVDQEDRGQGMQ